MDEQYLRDLYTQVLGREPDAEGFAHNLGLLQSGAISPTEMANAFVVSQEASQNTIPQAQEQQGAQAVLGGVIGNTEQRANELANQVYSAYGQNVNYDDALNELNSLGAIDPDAFYRARIGLLGKQMGWQIGQNTGDRNSVYQGELNSLIPGALSAGLSQQEIDMLVSGGSNLANQQNQRRIAEEAAKGQGWVNQNIPGGYVTLAALAAAAAAPYALGALGSSAGAAGAAGAGALETAGAAGLAGGGAFVPAVGSGASFSIVPGAAYTAAGLGANAVGQALPYTTAFDAANLYSQGLSQAAIEQNLAMTGIDSFLAADAAGLASQGLSDAAIAQNLSYGYSPAELAGTGIESMALTSGGTGIDNLLSSLGSALKTPLGQLGLRGGLGLLAGGGGGGAQPLIPPVASGSGTYAPRGQVDYSPILDLLAPRQIPRNTNSLLG
jgi:hypothetical protein